MATNLFVTGPANICVGTGTLGALEFLGWSVRGFSLQIRPYYEDAMTDLAGPAVPEDVLFLGMDAMIRFDLSRYEETVLAKLRAFLLGATEGAVASQTIGTLLNCEGSAIRLLIRSPFQTKDCFSDMRAVWNFPLAYVAEPIEMPFGTRISNPSVTFRAIIEHDSIASSGTLYDDDDDDAPAIS